MSFVLPPPTADFSNAIAPNTDVEDAGFPICLDNQSPPQKQGENLTLSHGWTAVLNGGNSIPVNTQITTTLTSSRTFYSYVDSPTSFLTVNRLFININGVIKSLLATSVDGTTVNFTFPSNFFTSAGTYSMRVYDTTGVGANLFCYVTGTITISPPPNTPVYLGNATVNASGNFDLAGTVMKTDRFPSDPHELVPRAYVDTYISSVMSYYDSILEPNNQLTSVLDRVSYLEAQLDRVYKALWDKSRDVSAIVTPHSGSIAANYTAASAPNPDLVDDAPVAPSSLTGFN
jgi:hypothetical protein